MTLEDKIDINGLIGVSKEAGSEIMKIYETDFEVHQKDDPGRPEGHSQLTDADLKANEVILGYLKKTYPEIPIISEESEHANYGERKNWEYFWLVDPLDGTKEFTKRNGNFTVNIALINRDTPVLGVVYVPVKDLLYYGSKEGSFKVDGTGEPQRLPLTTEKGDKYRVVASRRNKEEVDAFVESLKGDHGEVELMNIGSSLKFCLVAEGSADVYPRFGETSEWDTGAAHAVVKYAGKRVKMMDSDEELKYNKPEITKNGRFVVQ